MASSGDEESPPGISGPQDSDDDSVNNDEAGRDIAFYYKDDGADVRGPYSRDTFSRWFQASGAKVFPLWCSHGDSHGNKCWIRGCRFSRPWQH